MTDDESRVESLEEKLEREKKEAQQKKFKEYQAPKILRDHYKKERRKEEEDIKKIRAGEPVTDGEEVVEPVKKKPSGDKEDTSEKYPPNVLECLETIAIQNKKRLKSIVKEFDKIMEYPSVKEIHEAEKKYDYALGLLGSLFVTTAKTTRDVEEPATKDFVPVLEGAVSEQEILELLKDPKLLDKIVEDVQSQGVIGEEKPIKSTTLTISGKKVINKENYSTNSHLDDESNIGKDNLGKAIKKVVFYKDWIWLSNPTPTAITYSQRWDDVELPGGKKVRKTEGEKITKESIIYVEDATQSFIDGSDFKMTTGGDVVNVPKTIEHHYFLFNWKKPVVLISSADTTITEQLKGRLPSITFDSSKEQTVAIGKHQLDRDCDIIKKYKDKDYHALDVRKESFYRLEDVIVDLNDVKDYIIARLPKCTDVVMRRLRPRLLDYIKFSAVLHQFQREMLGKMSGKEWNRNGIYKVIQATKQDVDIGFGIFNYIYKTELVDVSFLNARQRKIYELFKKNAGKEFTIVNILNSKESGGVSKQQLYTDMREIMRSDEEVVLDEKVYPHVYRYGRLKPESVEEHEAKKKEQQKGLGDGSYTEEEGTD